MKLPSIAGSRRVLLVGLVAIFVFMGLILGNLAFAADENAMVVNYNSDQDKKNDGKCTLREAIVAANSDSQSGGKRGECKPVADQNGGYTILIDESQIQYLVPGVPKTLFQLVRTDSGSEDSSNTGDLDVAVPITITTKSTAPVVIEGGPDYGDRIFHILPTGKLTISNVAIRNGTAKELGGGLLVEGDLYISNSTLTNNNAGSSGGALYNTGNTNLNYVTVKDNYVGLANSPLLGGLVNSGGVLTVNNSYFDNNSCGGAIDGSADFNLARNSANCHANPALDDTGVSLIAVRFPAGGAPAAFEIPGDSSAVDAASAPGTECPATDQLGLFTRPQGAACDIGAMEKEFTYFVVTNTREAIEDVGSLAWAMNEANSTIGLSGIIFAIDAGVGGVPDLCGPSTINLSTSLPVIEQPVIVDGTLQEDGTRCPIPHITVEGHEDTAFSGFTILEAAAGSTIRDLIIKGFGGSGIVIGDFGAPSDGNLIEGNTISGNGLANPPVTNSAGAVLNDGITIIEGVSNTLSDNNIYNNADLSVDLGADGHTDNDPGDGDIGANYVQNYPELYAAALTGHISGILNSWPNKSYDLQFFSSASCLATDELSLLNETPIAVTTGSDGYAAFTELAGGPLAAGSGVVATATDADGNTSEFSNCVPASENNVVWTQAKPVAFGVPVNQFLGTVGEARWYKFSVKPGSKITIDLSNLPANYDLTVYKDIAQTYAHLLAANLDSEFDLNRLGAEAPSEVVSSTAFAPSAYTPSAYTPSAYTPSAYTPSAYTPSAYTPSAYTPSAYTQDVIAPSAYTPSAYTPSAYTPSAYTPSAYTPNETLDGSVDPALYSGAQLSSLIAVSAFDNQANESVTINTWTNTGEYYVRVRGRNGAFVPGQDYTLEITDSLTDCSGVGYGNVTGNEAGANAYYFGTNTTTSAPKTVVLVDWNRLGARYGGDPDVAGNSLFELNQALKNLADQTEVGGVIVEIGQANSLIEKLNIEAERADNSACPYAKNVVAEEIKKVIDGFRSPDLEYVVIAGNDDIVPFFRVPDSALLGPESWYQPPVNVFTSSEASLRGNFILTDDYYGAKYGVSYKDASIPAIDLATGRLVESPQDMLAQLVAYEKLAGGVVNHDATAADPAANLLPLRSTVTGYDFLVDAVEKISAELSDGTGLAPQELITPYGVAPLPEPGTEYDPSDPVSVRPWTAADLLATLDNNNSDIIFLAGHFSASTALAADFETGITTSEFLDLAADDDWENVIVYSAGCHSGYNIVDGHATPFTLNPDWASAFANRGSLLIGGTGYQYGDTEFIEYSERLYLYFTQQLRADTGAPVSVGQAMVAAKQQYLAETPVLRGIHQKALIEATIFGLPMLAVDMPTRLQESTEDSVVSVAPVSNIPGSALGLHTDDVQFDFTAHWGSEPNPLRALELQDTSGNTALTASWLTGEDGVLSNLGEPTLPLFAENVTDTANGYPLRGIGFRGGSYEDQTGIPFPDGSTAIHPLVGAATTEIRAVHLNFLSSFWFPVRTWSVNLFDNVFNGNAGVTTLFLTPAQYKTEDLSAAQPPPSTLRRFNHMDFRLYYSNYTTTVNDADNRPGLASPPNIARVTSEHVTEDPATGAPVNWVKVEALVVGNPGAGIQDVWVTYTGENGSAYHGQWQSVDLTQNVDDTRIWRGYFDISGADPQEIRFIVQACSGTGLCSLVDNVGNYFIPGDDGEKEPTALTTPASTDADDNAISAQKVGDEVTFSATLSPDTLGADVSNLPVFFGLGQESRLGITDASGNVAVTFLLVSAPGDYEVTAWFPGNGQFAASTSAPLPFSVDQQSTALTLTGPATAVIGEPLPVTATLTDQSASQLPLAEQAILFAIFTGNSVSCPADDEIAGGAGAAAYKTVITGLEGKATLGSADLSSGTYTVCAYFRANPSYSGSSAANSVIINSSPVATDDSYIMNVDAGSLIELAPGVLENDTDADGDMLTAALLSLPSNGTLDAFRADGSFIYTAAANSTASGDSFTYQVCDVPLGACDPVPATVTIIFNRSPDCKNVEVLTLRGDYPTLWPANKRETDIYLSGATDTEDDLNHTPLKYFFKSIRQDEAIDDVPDAFISNSCSDAWVRSERDGFGDGRVYEIAYRVYDSAGAFCESTVDIATLPHDQSGDTLANKGPLVPGESASCSLTLP